MSALSPPPPLLSMRTQHKFRKVRCFLHQKVRTSASEGPPLVRTGKPPGCGRLYGQPLPADKLSRYITVTGLVAKSASQSELGLMLSLMGVRTEEAAFAFAGFKDHSSRWSKAFWTEWIAFNGSGEEDQMAR